jgi:hypothetical protein
VVHAELQRLFFTQNNTNFVIGFALEEASITLFEKENTKRSEGVVGREHKTDRPFRVPSRSYRYH